MNERILEGIGKMELGCMMPVVTCENKSEIIIFDVETTGLDFYDSEILQISVIDGDGNTLINEYVKPYWTDSWEGAMAVNQITPEMVKDCKEPHELIPVVRGIFESAKLLISYNGEFDLGMLKRWGVKLKEGQKHYDVMREFAPIYGEWNEKYHEYKWQKLVKCAAYYEYEFKAHDSLEDVRATYHCYKKMNGIPV